MRVETVVITKDLFEELVISKANSLIKDGRKKYFGRHEAKRRLGCKSNTTFYRLLERPDCPIKKGRVNGEYYEGR